jgi:hypothetical protein
MGGSVLSGGAGYDAWVAGYAGTAKTTVQAADVGGGKVSAYLTVLNDGGTTSYYHGYYYVDTAAGKITGASIQQDCETNPAGSAPDSALAPGSLAYWLAHGGRWFVHGETLQISQGSSGLTGTMTWNAGGNVWTGTAHLAFTHYADGTLAGTFTDNAAYAQTGSDTSSFPQPDPGGPQQGQTITLAPVSPMLAKMVYDSSSPAMFAGGNTNLCQLGLPNETQYCGA